MVQPIDITLDELRKLRHRIDGRSLDLGDWTIFGTLVSRLIARTEGKQERMIAKLAAAAAAENASTKTGHVIDAEYAVDSEQTASAPGATATDTGAVAEVSDGTPTGATAGAYATEPEPTKIKGHGRNGADAYVTAKHILHALMLGIIGAVCEACGAGRGAGRRSRYREKVIVRIVGQPLFGAEVHHIEQARCRICKKIIRAMDPASLLEGIGTDYVVYDWSACAMLIVMHYFGGAPFKRLESLHEGWGVPLADSNQWNVVDKSDDLLRPLYEALEQHGIQKATSLRIDDTGSMVIAIRRQIQADVAALKLLGESTNDVRTGINVTGVYLETQNEKIILFYTGRHHAGEIVDQLLKHRRTSSPKLVKVTDAASKNFDHEHEDKLIEATCNAHALLKFRDIRDKFPAEYAFAGELYKKVFDNDDDAKARGMTPTERMLYHREHSKPLMEKLKAMCEQKITNRLVEPRSPLWEPLTFILNQWSRLTKFYEEPGVPLDTNLVEQTLIIPVRYLAGSFNYKTETGAEVGDHHMSLVATARANDVEPVAYLTDCLRNHKDLAERPQHYLPWAYRDRLKARDEPPRNAAREHPNSVPPRLYEIARSVSSLDHTTE